MLFNHLLFQFIYGLAFFSIFCHSYTLIYHTENSPASQYFDCLYYTQTRPQNSIQAVKYCRQHNTFYNQRRNFSQDCYNNGHRVSFEDLSNTNISILDILKWNSSMEQADRYAKYLFNNSLGDIENNYICNCTNPSTFGKFCEYKFYLADTFNEAIYQQFHPIESMKVNIGSQLHQNRPCYITWICNTGLLCADWRYVCDGKQQCENGVDEDYCELLEFNECEDNEYRCLNGMCIPEEYWLDGDYDCMDWSDEIHTLVNTGKDCSDGPSLICDEHICPYNQWSCGDGECVADQTDRHTGTLANRESFCKNMRDISFMCEAVTRNGQSWWTIDDGYCLPFSLPYRALLLDTQLVENNCTFSIRCALSNSLSQDCICKNVTECRVAVNNSCALNLIAYPLLNAVISPYIFMVYVKDRDWTKKKPDAILYQGQVKCIGYQLQAHFGTFSLDVEYLSFYDYIVPEYRLCNRSDSNVYRDYSGPQYDAHCWNNSKTFNNRSYQVSFQCQTRCISKYRLRDGIIDCYFIDEIFAINNSCSQIQRHRLQCSSSELTCLLVGTLGNWGAVCSNGRDEFDHKTNTVLLNNIRCASRTDPGCNYLQKYIRMSSIHDINIEMNTNDNKHLFVDYSSTVIPFRSYCNSFFDTRSGFDESPELCQRWTCLNDEYQCLSGQCIPQSWICDGEWDCSDGSDEQRIFIMNNLTDYNRNLMNLTIMKEQCYQRYRSDNIPFSKICNISYEYPCFRTGVIDPFNLTLNRPCINITQIGDGITDCLSGLDERNRLQCPSMGMLGFHFQLNNQLCATYRKLCVDYPWTPDANIDYTSVCFYRRKYFRNGTESDCYSDKDVMCLNDTCIKGARCNGIMECSHGEDEFRCIPSDKSPFTYRLEKQTVRSSNLSKLLTYPLPTTKSSTRKLISARDNTHLDGLSIINMNEHFSQVPKLNMTLDQQTNVDKISSSTRISTFGIIFNKLPTGTITVREHLLPFICNRGLAVSFREMDMICLCPPSFYGTLCEYYNDRITILTHLDLINYPWNSQQVAIIKVLATFWYKELIIDHYEFHVNPWLEKGHNFIKQTIYFLYPRSEHLLRIKHSNRDKTQVYNVQFEAFNLYLNGTIESIAIWQYPIYFDFLPAFRLSKILRFPLPAVSPRFNSLCSSNPCGQNGNCQDIINSNGTLYFCTCHHGYYGMNCESYDEQCSNFCSPNALCKPEYRGVLTGDRSPLCICPVSTFGNTCHIKNDRCQSNPCLNGGTCFMAYDMTDINKYICLCTDLYNGEQCQYSNGIVEITIISSSNSTSQTFDVAAITVSYNNYDLQTLRFDIQHQQVYNTIPSYIKQMYNYKVGIHAPPIAIMKVYSPNYRNEEPNYYLLYFYRDEKDINITVSLTSENHCPIIEPLDYSDNSTLNSTTVIFSYHHICQSKQNTNTTLICFRDFNYLCLCQDDYQRAECFIYNHSIDHCSHCLSNGYCLKGDLNNKRDFLCLCQHCHYGQMCQYSNEFMGFTLDSLIVKDTIQNHRLFSSIYMSIIFLIFSFGLFNNLCSFLTFIQSKPRKFGVGNYLFLISIINQCSLLLLFFKIIHIIFGSNGSLVIYENGNFYSCKIVSYLLSVFTRITYWLTSFVSLERLCIVLFPTSSIMKNIHFALGLSLLAMLIVSGMHIHELLYYTTIVDSSDNSILNITLCVPSYTESFVSIYSRVNVLIHYFIPFLLQVISITITIIQTACSRARTNGSGRTTFRDLFKKQLKTQREHYITPIIIVLSSLPQAILSFSYACKELKQSWQRYTLLIAYFLSYLPQMLGFILHVLPSTTFSEEFHKTMIGKRFFKRQRTIITRKQNLKRKV